MDKQESILIFIYVCSMLKWYIYIYISKKINPFGSDTKKFWENEVKTMSADALAPCITRTPATMVLTVLDKQFLVFHFEGFQLPVPILCWDKKNMKKFYVFTNKISTRRVIAVLIYCQTSNIRCTKSQNLTVSCLILQLSLPNLLKPDV